MSPLYENSRHIRLLTVFFLEPIRFVAIATALMSQRRDAPSGEREMELYYTPWAICLFTPNVKGSIVEALTKEEYDSVVGGLDGVHEIITSDEHPKHCKQDNFTPVYPMADTGERPEWIKAVYADELAGLDPTKCYYQDDVSRDAKEDEQA